MKITEAILVLFTTSRHYVLQFGTKITWIDSIVFTKKFTLYGKLPIFLLNRYVEVLTPPAMKKAEALLVLFTASTYYVLLFGTIITWIDSIVFTKKFTLYGKILTFLPNRYVEVLPPPPSPIPTTMKKIETILVLFTTSRHYVLTFHTEITWIDSIVFTKKLHCMVRFSHIFQIDILKLLPPGYGENWSNLSSIHNI